MTRFETAMLGELKARHPQILEAIRTSREVSADTEEKLKAFLDDFVKTFA